MAHILMRCDGDATIGLGHVMRCLALGEALLEQGAEVTFLCRRCPDPIAKRIGEAGAAIEYLASAGTAAEADEVIAEAQARGAAAVVIDGYAFTPDFFARLDAAPGLRRVAIDDLMLPACRQADLIVNQNPHARAEDYAGCPGRLLLGLSYGILRREFRGGARPERRFDQPVRRVLISCGGADPANATTSAIQALDAMACDALEVVALAGAANPFMMELDGAAQLSRHDVAIVRNTAAMAHVMAWADIAIVAGGTTLWECAWAGLPTLALIVADNQAPGVEAFARAGGVIALDWRRNAGPGRVKDALAPLFAAPALRARLSQTAAAQVDGLGAARVARAVLDLAAPP
ncbi:MAG: UDP-2,4-diacetamido-2,4,6-trideoxy-beta-L-altropyranose hydrolase [Pseudomonadota bacterium]